MALKVEHELHQRRMGRNLGLLLVLVGFVALVFGLTVVKVKRGDFAAETQHSIPDPAATAGQAKNSQTKSGAEN